MKRMKWLVTVLAFLTLCFPVSVLADTDDFSTDVYVGVITLMKPNVHFWVVDEEDKPIDGASIEIWANEQLGYQLLGVTHDGGTYDSIIPYGNYHCKVYKTGYETTEINLVLSGSNNPHIEKVVLKKSETPSAPSSVPVRPTGSSLTVSRPIKTGDISNLLLYLLPAVISILLLVILLPGRKNTRESGG